MQISFKAAHSSNYYSGRAGNNIRYIVVHYTANNGDTAKNNADYFSGANRQASAHYFVDENEVWQSVRDTDAAWHCGGSLESNHHPLRGICTNRNSIGIEMCSDKVGGKFVITAETVARTVTLVRELMQKYDIPASRVVRHYDVTGKSCPEPWVRDAAQWKTFQKQLTEDSKEEKSMLTYEQFQAYMTRYERERDAKKPNDWAASAWEAMQKAGITDGTAPQSPLTREQFAVMCQRMGLVEKGES